MSNSQPSSIHTIIIGAGAAGMMCGAVLGARGLGRVLILDQANQPGEKIRISGGGRCNFTNLKTGPHNFISQNPHFCKSALAGYRPQEFVDLVNSYKIAWHEKNPDMGLGQLFCDGKSGQIIDMLRSECMDNGAKIQLATQIHAVEKTETGFAIATDKGSLVCQNLVVACGGPSIPKMGASGFGYEIARQFGLDIIDPIAALVPLVFTDGLKTALKELSGISVMAEVSHKKAGVKKAKKINFREALLFTHRGLSGPSILQISSYWTPGQEISIDLAPDIDAVQTLKAARQNDPKTSPLNCLAQFLPRKLATFICQGIGAQNMADLSDKAIATLAASVNEWRLKPAGTEGMRTAEVTKGGVDTSQLSSKSMQVKTVDGLYFIGEVVDVTGHLGGHNFQWAWASGVACGRSIV